VKHSSLKSIKIQPLILLFTAVLPALGIIVHLNLELERQDIEKTKTDATIMLQSLANDRENVIEVTRRLLMILGKLPALQTRDSSTCNSLFRELLRQMSTGTKEGVFTAIGIDGAKCLFAYKLFSPDNGSSPYFYMLATIPYEQISAGTKKHFYAISDRREVEQHPKESDARHHTTTEFSNDRIAIVAGGSFIYTNRKFLEIFGRDKPEEIIGHKITIAEETCSG
jgi:PAS domain-containing protein